MKRKKGMLCALALVLALLPACALGETTFDGTVVAGESVSVTAPFGGTVSSFRLRAGSLIALGDRIAAIETTKVYASADGVIAGVFAQPGDAIENVTSRYGAVMYIVPDRKYSISAGIEKAYNSSETKYINIGETVYITCASDGAHTAQGIVTAASGTTYTVETTSGELLMEETVNLYRDASRSTKTRVGKGTVGRTAEIAVTGSGSLLKLHVQDGDRVSRGDLLFETVTGQVDGLFATDNEIVSDVNGVVASVNTSAGATVNKGDTLLTVYTMDSAQIEISVDEYDLVTIAEGDRVRISFNYDESKTEQTEGVVSMISHISSEASGGEASYQAYIDFTPDEDVRIGMTVVVTTIDAEDAPEESGDIADEHPQANG